jgi:hypothetical protein
MTKQEFLERMGQEKPLKDYLLDIEVDKLIDSPYLIGCYEDDSIWRVYKTVERGGYYIIEQFDNENDAFDFLYALVYEEKKMDDYVKQQREQNRAKRREEK